MQIRFFVGYDARMPSAYAVAVRSLLSNSKYIRCDVTPLLISDLQAKGDYTRPTIQKDGHLYDVISEAPMSTEFAISRFLCPYLSDFKGFSFFCDSDFLFRCDIVDLLDLIDPKYAVQCVKHNYAPTDSVKMDGQVQTQYSRKNWSSMMIFNNAHPDNKVLTPEYINSKTGRDLHAFCWLEDDKIGGLSETYNWLEGHSSLDIDPQIVHYTRGTPDMVGYENVPYAAEWWQTLGRVALCKRES